MMGNFGWGFEFGGLWMIVFWVVIIALVVWAVKQFSGNGSGGHGCCGGHDVKKEDDKKQCH